MPYKIYIQWFDRASDAKSGAYKLHEKKINLRDYMKQTKTDEQIRRWRRRRQTLIASQPIQIEENAIDIRLVQIN